MLLEKTTLGSISINGKGEYGLGASAEPFSKTKYTYLRITDINDDGTINTSDLKSVTVDDPDKYLLKENDIVFARTGASTGRNYFYNKNDGNFIYAGFLIKFSLDKSKVNPKFIKYYCLSKEYKDWISSYNTGSTRGNINAKTLADMPLLLPPMEYQNKCVDLLTLLDEKIACNNKINKNLEQQAFTLFRKMFPNITLKEKMIGDFIIPKRGKNLLSNNTIFGNIPVVAGGVEPSTYHNVANTKAPVITISASGANSGYVRLWNIPVWSSDSSFIDSSMTKDVYFWYVMLKKRQKEIYDSQTGSAQPHIYPQHIAIMPIKNIDPFSIDIFTNAVTPLFQKIGTNIKENESLTSIRDNLLPKLLSGELDVSSINLDI